MVALPILTKKEKGFFDYNPWLYRQQDFNQLSACVVVYHPTVHR